MLAIDLERFGTIDGFVDTRHMRFDTNLTRFDTNLTRFDINLTCFDINFTCHETDVTFFKTGLISPEMKDTGFDTGCACPDTGLSLTEIKQAMH